MFFVSQTHSFSNQGENFLDALQLSALLVSSKIEGKSLAEVWAINRLEANDEGESVIHYRGNPEVVPNMSGGSSLLKVQ